MGLDVIAQAKIRKLEAEITAIESGGPENEDTSLSEDEIIELSLILGGM